MHVQGLPSKWQNLNKNFIKNGLIHKLHKGSYKINFKLTGFDSNSVTVH